MISLNLKLNEGAYVLTNYVLEQIYGEKPPAKYSSEEEDKGESLESSDEFTFPVNPTKQVKPGRVERMKGRTTKCKIYQYKNFQLVEHL